MSSVEQFLANFGSEVHNLVLAGALRQKAKSTFQHKRKLHFVDRNELVK